MPNSPPEELVLLLFHRLILDGAASLCFSELISKLLLFLNKVKSPPPCYKRVGSMPVWMPDGYADGACPPGANDKEGHATSVRKLLSISRVTHPPPSTKHHSRSAGISTQVGKYGAKFPKKCQDRNRPCVLPK